MVNEILSNIFLRSARNAVRKDASMFANGSSNSNISGFGANAHVIVFCEQDVIDLIRENIRSILSYYGGVAYLSEAIPL